MNKTYRSKKKIYRKKKRSFKLRGGTYLRNTINSKSRVLHPLNAFVKKKLGDLYAIIIPAGFIYISLFHYFIQL